MILILFCRLLWLNLRVQGEHLTSQLSWAASCLTISHMCVCTICLVDEFSPCALQSLMVGLMVVLVALCKLLVEYIWVDI